MKQRFLLEAAERPPGVLLLSAAALPRLCSALLCAALASSGAAVLRSYRAHPRPAVQRMSCKASGQVRWRQGMRGPDARTCAAHLLVPLAKAEPVGRGPCALARRLGDVHKCKCIARHQPWQELQDARGERHAIWQRHLLSITCGNLLMLL